MATGVARHGTIEIAYEVEGPADGTPLLLIMGLGLQMLFWPDGFRRLLVERGFRVARFDNRDVGRSTHLPGRGLASPRVLLTRRPGYGLPDMAGDAVSVLDALGWSSAHVAGVSLGGMIAQLVAVLHPERVRTLTSLSSTPSPHIGRPHPRALPALLSGTAHDRDQAAEHMVRIFRIIGSPGYPLDEPWLRAVAARSFDRAHDPDGVRRQLAAVVLAADRRPLLRGLRLPALVVHGDADPLVRPSGGRATARAIPGARLVVYPRMGHDLPGALQPAIVDEIAGLSRRWAAG
ncbi:alpha/beta hydrolase [Paractinoplanes deccanensis]|uniref:Alpha/beta hydrolase n=1 Tax=Paractinoplanes deccanensis TaxID=113561 RepID=A0ABQ3YEG6_9ACTN|nr:alpha/beta hydrolase [Actinoplanes deccanensis]GID78411.1 alpha/beta hydrolase [Actinoplanes deccanensis]